VIERESFSFGGEWETAFFQGRNICFISFSMDLACISRYGCIFLSISEPASVSKKKLSSFLTWAGQNSRVNFKVVLFVWFSSKRTPSDDTCADIFTVDETEGKSYFQTCAARLHVPKNPSRSRIVLFGAV